MLSNGTGLKHTILCTSSQTECDVRSGLILPLLTDPEILSHGHLIVS